MWAGLFPAGAHLFLGLPQLLEAPALLGPGPLPPFQSQQEPWALLTQTLPPLSCLHAQPSGPEVVVDPRGYCSQSPTEPPSPHLQA